MINVSIESLVNNGVSRLALGCLIAFWLLGRIDPRRLAILPRLILIAIAFCLGVKTVAVDQNNSARIAWVVTSSLTAILALLMINRWRLTSPREIHQEEQQVNRGRSKKRSSISASSDGGLSSRLAVLTVSASTVALLLTNLDLISPISWLARIGATAQTLATILMTGIGLVVGLEMTYASTPDALSVAESKVIVNWRMIARWASLAALVIASCCCAQLLIALKRPVVSGPQGAVEFAARVFGMILLLMTFVLWMVPHRLANYQLRNQIPHDWITLLLAAWVGLAGFIVVGTLPIDWPWLQLLR